MKILFMENGNIILGAKYCHLGSSRVATEYCSKVSLSPSLLSIESFSFLLKSLTPLSSLSWMASVTRSPVMVGITSEIQDEAEENLSVASKNLYNFNHKSPFSIGNVDIKLLLPFLIK